MIKKNIIQVCNYVAGVESLGMAQLKQEFAELTNEEIGKRDNFKLEPHEGYDFHYRKNTTGIRYEDENEGGEVSLFDELEVP